MANMLHLYTRIHSFKIAVAFKIAVVCRNFILSGSS